MVRASFPLVRLMGVDVRLHWTFPLLFVAALAFGHFTAGNAARGAGVFAALVFAVVVREVARAVAAVYSGLDLRVVFLLPIGGVMGFAPGPQVDEAPSRTLIYAAPAANLAAGLTILGLSYAVAPGVQLLQQPWVSATNVLRSFVWMQFFLAAVNLLPAATLPSRQLLRPNGAVGETSQPAGSSVAATPARSAAAFSLVTGLAIALVFAGFFTLNVWFVILGGFLLLYSQMRARTSPQAASATDGDAILVEEVMCADYIVLSSSDTLRGALDRVLSTTQEVFPVVRGDRMVGAISRQTLQSNLQTSGDSYVQGVMTRTLSSSQREEPLGTALNRATALGYTGCIAVVDGFEGRAGGRVLGLLTPQTVQSAVQHLKLTRSPDQAQKPRA